jgi:hypothetical protein
MSAWQVVVLVWALILGLTRCNIKASGCEILSFYTAPQSPPAEHPKALPWSLPQPEEVFALLLLGCCRTLSETSILYHLAMSAELISI